MLMGDKEPFFVKPPAFWSEEFYLTMTFSRERVQKCFSQHETLDLHFRKNNPAMNCEHALEGEANDQRQGAIAEEHLALPPPGWVAEPAPPLQHLVSINAVRWAGGGVDGV